MKPSSINELSRTTQPVAPEASSENRAAKTASRAPAEAITAPTSAQRAQLGNVPPPHGRLDMNDARAQAAIAEGLRYLGGRGIGEAPFAAQSVDVDNLGVTHVRFDRLVDGIKVFGEQIVTHAKDGKVDGATGAPGQIQRSLGGPPPILSKDQALALARTTFAGKPEGLPVIERVVFADDAGAYRSGFHVCLTSLKLPDPRRMHYLIDAAMPAEKAVTIQWNEIDSIGTELDSSPRPRKTRSESPRQATGNTLYSGQVKIVTSTDAKGNYVLEDKSRSQGVETRDAMNEEPPGVGPLSVPISAESSLPITDDNNVWGEPTDSERQKGAVDAHFGMEMWHDMAREMLGVDSFDLKGARLLGIAHIGTRYNNAFWDGEKMNFGDGDGKRFSYLTTKDVTGHEITHGLVKSTCGLIYRHQSGGLNEGCADIGGFLTEYYTSKKYPSLKWNWAIGEGCFMPHGSDPDAALRYMDDPTKDGKSIDNFKFYDDSLNVHRTSGILNNFFYQLVDENADGKKKANSVSRQRVEKGIGVENAAKIFIRAMQFYMTPKCTFAQARDAWIKAATDIFPPSDQAGKENRRNAEIVDTVAQAWSVVGVESPSAPSESDASR